jgi:hypothetical protein
VYGTTGTFNFFDPNAWMMMMNPAAWTGQPAPAPAAQPAPAQAAPAPAPAK